MKYFFIETRYEKKFKLPKNLVKKLPKRIGLFTTIQFIDSIPDIEKQLKNNNIKTYSKQSKNYYYRGKKTAKFQLLGCNIEKIDDKVDAYLYIGDGIFHPRILAFNNKKPIYIYNPIEKKTSEIDKNTIGKILKRQKGAYIKFLTSKKIGVIISTKPGQNLFKEALKLKNKYPDKIFYFLVFDTINYQHLENFPFIECFVNTACPRMGLDDSDQFPKPVINLKKVLN